MIINSVNSYQNSAINRYEKSMDKPHARSADYNTAAQTTPSFNGLLSDLVGTNKFATAQEKQAYKELSGTLKGKDKANFELLYKTGRLSDRNSNDKSSTIENLYRIYKEPRIIGLSKEKILSETVERLANPFIINQKFSTIPAEIATEVIKSKQQEKVIKSTLSSGIEDKPNDPKGVEDINVQNSASCVAASIEFNLADKKPAEFARLAQGLTSPKMGVISKVKYSDVTPSIIDAMQLFKMFNVEITDADWHTADIKIAPDRDAIIRARVQSTYGNKENERAAVDILMQSAFMQVGSQSTYNSLTDKRYGQLNTNNTGLTEFEKTFTETVINNEGEKTSMTYQNVDENAVLQGYNTGFEVICDHLLKSLSSGHNVIIGITETDSDKKIIGGHEITVIAAKTGADKELYFVCNDTDDTHNGPIEIKAKDLIPKIHHAGIPTKILGPQPIESNGLNLLREYSTKLQKSA
ncbi:MAG: hypothetical protein PHX18_01980 [Candidatus Gastranaerophilales bacterium]|nr:hypothetical protein [Candidatus Gastranaerophilales bacterium]